MVAQQILPPAGRYQAIIDMFRTDGGFGYAALGYMQNDNGFNIDDHANNYGFKELLVTQVDGYDDRPQLQLYDGNDAISLDPNGKVIVNFEVELDTETIVPKQGSSTEYITINQIAIVNNAETNSDNSTILLAATFTNFRKTPDIAISFILEVKM
jgi:hypothetical protein